MKNVFRTAILLATMTTTAIAADYTDGDIHKNDYKWMQFNLMHGQNNQIPFGNQDDTYLEMEFGGRSGIVELYGYFDLFDILDSSSSDRHEGNGNGYGTDANDNFFVKFNPKFSIDGMTKKDLAIGPVKEWFVSTQIEAGDGQLWTNFLGLGANVEVPLLGTIGVNGYARHVKESYGDSDEGKWDGYRLSTNWFKPIYFLDNGTFIAYQGYIDYDFAMDEKAKNPGKTDHSLQWFNGIYWHSDRYSVGYGLKVYDDFTGIKAQGDQDTTGIGHYFAVGYKY